MIRAAFRHKKPRSIDLQLMIAEDHEEKESALQRKTLASFLLRFQMIGCIWFQKPFLNLGLLENESHEDG